MTHRILIVLLLAAALPAFGATAPADTTLGSGTEDDPWLIDLDELLADGYAVIVSPMDTVAVADAAVDTIAVTAPRLRVSEVVRKVAEAMDAIGRDGSIAFTLLQRVDLFDRRGADDERREEVVEAWRIHVDAEGEERMSRLYRETREWEAGELVETEVDEEVTQEWQEEVAREVMAMPFSLLTANRYRYEIKERNLIGDHLVFRIGFTPRSRFEAGLEGDVWLDYSDFVIRRMEGRLVGPMPVPLVIREVPRFTFTLRQVGDRWVGDAFHGRVLLNGSLPKIPDEMEFHVRMDDYDFTPEAAR